MVRNMKEALKTEQFESARMMVINIIGDFLQII